MPTTKSKTLIFGGLISLLGFTSCKSATQNLAGGVKTGSVAEQSDQESVPEKAEEQLASTSKPSSPTAMPAPVSTGSEPTVSIPGNITGAFLVCVNNSTATSMSTSATVACALKQAPLNNNISLASFTAVKWGTTNTDPSLTISEDVLPTNSSYQYLYKLAASSPAALRSSILALNFTLTTKDKDGRTLTQSVPSNIIVPEAPDDEQIRLKNNPGQCLDLSGGTTTPGTDILVYGCNSFQNQKFSVNDHYQITAKGVCLSYSKTGKNTIAADCAGVAGEVPPSFVISGNSIRLVNSDLCLGIGYGVGKIVTCDANDANQQWTIGKKVFVSIAIAP